MGNCKKGSIDEWYTYEYICMECGMGMMLCDREGYHHAPKFCASCGEKLKLEGNDDNGQSKQR